MPGDRLKPFIFHRASLAERYCDNLEGRLLPDSRSGLFLAAPRRTGKSTFLKEDLLPAMARRKWLCLYVDLWKDKSRDPAELVSEEIQKKLTQFAGPLEILAKKTGLEKVSLYGILSFNVKNNSTELPKQVSLPDALETLSFVSNRPLALIIDEAQHALTTPTGVNAMFALKSARDQLNIGSETHKLSLVFTGSNRDKLAFLVLDRRQPFFGSFITKFPLLDKEYTNLYSDYLNQTLSGVETFKKTEMFDAFKILGHRPQLLTQVISEAIFGDPDLKNDDQSLIALAKKLMNQIFLKMEGEVSVLTKTQQVVFEVLVKHHENYTPFSEATMREYSSLLGKKVSTATVQSALEVLRNKNLIWKESFGGYVLEDESFIGFYNATKGMEPLGDYSPS
jgi:hypothetical protein